MRLFLGIAVAATLALCGVIVIESLPYFTFRSDLDFLVEKAPVSSERVWRCCFYAHVFGGLVCLASAPFLFWNRLRERFPGLHRRLGRVYGVAVLGCAGPTGIYLALHAKGGFAGQAGFLLLGLLWWGATAQGVRSIVAGRAAAHRRWMIRSYALALSAVSFRVLHLGFFWAGMANDPNYVLSLWLSLATSLVGGEAFLRRRPAEAGSLSWKGGVS